MQDALKLTTYVGERHRCGGRPLADALMDAHARHRIRASALLRGLEGFGLEHTLQTERLLSLSEDLPILTVALDSPSRIQALLHDVLGFCSPGLITLERARLLDAGDADPGSQLPPGELKLTVNVGRLQRAGGAPDYRAVVACMQRHGLGGASVLLAVDGTAHGVRRRARFFAANGEVPLVITGIGDSESIARALPELQAMLAGATIAIERVRVCKRDGVLLGGPGEPTPRDARGLPRWQKLTVYAEESSRHRGEPLHGALMRRLRAHDAAGATALRGIWGYHGAHRAHGERFWALGRRVPLLTVLLDTPANTMRSFEIVDELTAETGLVTSELVPALRAGGALEIAQGGLELAAPSW